MSAYVVEPYVIDFVLSAFDEVCRDRGSLRIWIQKPNESVRSIELPYGDFDSLSKVGQIILSENVKSVSYRYNDRVNDDEPAYRFKRHRAVYEGDRRKLIVQAVKAVECIEYQSCEHPQWIGSDAQVILNSMARRLASEMPGNSEAEWGAPPHLPEGKGPISLMDMVAARRAE